MTAKRLTYIYLVLFLVIAQPFLLDLTHAHDFLFTKWLASEELHSHDCSDVELHKPLTFTHNCLACSRITAAGEAAVSATLHFFFDPALFASGTVTDSYRSSDADLVLLRGPPASPS